MSEEFAIVSVGKKYPEFDMLVERGSVVQGQTCGGRFEYTEGGGIRLYWFAPGVQLSESEAFCKGKGRIYMRSYKDLIVGYAQFQHLVTSEKMGAEFMFNASIYEKERQPKDAYPLEDGDIKELGTAGMLSNGQFLKDLGEDRRFCIHSVLVDSSTGICHGLRSFTISVEMSLFLNREIIKQYQSPISYAEYTNQGNEYMVNNDTLSTVKSCACSCKMGA